MAETAAISSTLTADSNAALIDGVRNTVLADVELKVADKMRDLWSRGSELLKQIEQEGDQKTEDLRSGLARCREKQDSLSVEQEQLRKVLANMVKQFTLLGTVFGAAAPAGPAPAAADATTKVAPLTPAPASCLGGASAANGPGSVASTTASGETPAVLASSASGVQDSTPDASTPAYVGGSVGAPSLPALPDFPFPVVGAAGPSLGAATPLSLAEALGPDSSRIAAPLPARSTIASTPSTEGAPASRAKMFSFTLRKADGTSLGLNVSHMTKDNVLRVEGVRPEGAVEAWNRQCVGSASAEKAVMVGDRIISVNGVFYDPVKMLEECRDRQLLKLTIIRVDGHGAPPGLPTPTQAGTTTPTPKSTTTLRADASEFVPTGLVSEQVATKDDADNASSTESTSAMST